MLRGNDLQDRSDKKRTQTKQHELLDCGRRNDEIGWKNRRLRPDKKFHFPQMIFNLPNGHVGHGDGAVLVDGLDLGRRDVVHAQHQAKLLLGANAGQCNLKNVLILLELASQRQELGILANDVDVSTLGLDSEKVLVVTLDLLENGLNLLLGALLEHHKGHLGLHVNTVELDHDVVRELGDGRVSQSLGLLELALSG